MSDNNAGKKWWKKSIWKLPLWAWILIVIVIISAIGSSGSSQNETSSVENNSETTEQNQSDTTIRETEETTAPSKPEMTASQENAVNCPLSTEASSHWLTPSLQLLTSRTIRRLIGTHKLQRALRSILILRVFPAMG
jgi:hypothetical protein